jgi:hypothetical protein
MEIKKKEREILELNVSEILKSIDSSLRLVKPSKSEKSFTERMLNFSSFVSPLKA